MNIPNALSASRILASPLLIHSILTEHYPLALGTLVYCGISDVLDGFLARRLKQESTLGSILDPIGDKLLIGSLVLPMTYTGLFPVSLAVLILARDASLLLSGFYIRLKSLPPPFSWRTYFDPSIPSAEVRPTLMSKLNTVLQVGLLGGTLLYPMLGFVPQESTLLCILQWSVAGTTLWSGLSYIRHHRQVVRYLHKQ